MSPPAWPSPEKCLCVWAALGGCHDKETYPQSFSSKSNFCANHRGLIKILIETKHKWQLPQLHERTAKSVYIFGLRRSYFYRALKSRKADGDFLTGCEAFHWSEGLKILKGLEVWHRKSTKSPLVLIISGWIISMWLTAWPTSGATLGWTFGRSCKDL